MMITTTHPAVTTDPLGPDPIEEAADSGGTR